MAELAQTLNLSDGVPFYELPGRLPDIAGAQTADLPDWVLILIGAAAFALAGAASGLWLHI